MRIVLTGGHVTPALALIRELHSRGQKDIHFIGRKYAQYADTETSYEYKEVTRNQVLFHHLTTGRLTRMLSLRLITNVFLLFVGFIQSFVLLLSIKPRIIMSFGGYLALPVCVVGKLLGITIYTHEQTIQPGAANKFIAKLANKVFITFNESSKHFPQNKTVVTGNLLRPEIAMIINRPIKKKITKPLLYITGGSLGSHSINVHIETILDELLQTFVVLHQTGNVQQYNDFARLSTKKHADYFVVPHTSSAEIGWVYNNAHIIVSRSGANTALELIAGKIPAVLIPLPWSANREQQQHAALLSEVGAARVFDQYESSQKLLETIMDVHKNASSMSHNYKKLQSYLKENPAQHIADILLT